MKRLTNSQRIARAFEMAMAGATNEELAAALGINPERAAEIFAIHLDWEGQLQ